MKHLSLSKLGLAVLAMTFATQNAFAAPRTQSASRWGLGVSTSNFILRGMDSLSSIHVLDDKNAIQTYFAISGTSPFVFGMGGVYKHTVAGTRRGGLHVGGGLGLGTVGGVVNQFTGAGGTAFFINFLGNLGIHFTVPGVEQLMMSFDAGLALSITDGNAEFGIGPYSNTLGMSVHWLF